MLQWLVGFSIESKTRNDIAESMKEARASAKTPEEQKVIDLQAGQRYASYAQQDRATEDLIDRARERPDRPRPPYIRPPWELDAQAEIHAAEEMRELARRHRDMAAQAR